MEHKQRKNNFLLHGSILALAGIICRVIGVVYRVPMTNFLGSEGLAYYSRAYNVYNIALIVSSYGMPLAVSKMIAKKVALREYINEKRVLMCSLVFAISTGLITALTVYFGADYFAVVLFKMPECALPLKVLSPTIFLCAIMGTLRGYFQGKGNMIPTAVSQIVEQVVNAVISVVATMIFINTYKSKSYGAAGGTLGTTLGAMAGLIVLLIIFFITNKSRNTRTVIDDNGNIDSYKAIYKVILATVVPIIISQTVYNINGLLDSAFFSHFNKSNNNKILLGSYDVYIIMVSIPIAIATALSNSIVPSIVSEKAKGNIHAMKQKIAAIIRFNMIIAIPSAIGLAVLAKNILSLLFGGSINIEISSKILMIGALAVVFYVLSTVSTGILQANDMMKVPIINSIIALILHLVVIFILLKVDFGIYALAVGNTVFALLVCLLNSYVIRKKIGYIQEIKKTFFIPSVCSVVMGGLAVAICRGMNVIVGSNAVATIVSIMCAIIMYGILMLKRGGIDKEDMKKFIKNESLYKVLYKMHILK